MIQCLRLTRLIAFTGCLALIFGCKLFSGEDSMESKSDAVVFKLETGEVTIDISALTTMKNALEAFIDGPAFPARFAEHREAMKHEVRASAPWIQNGEAGIGLWKLEVRDRSLELTRRPPPAKATQYLYHARLNHADGGWKIVALEQEREYGPR
jgi:hypothetical protein